MGLNLILAFAMRSPKVLQYTLIFSALTLGPAICGDAPVIDRSNFDMKIQPGDDFYQFTNGGWLDRNPIPPEYSQWGSFQELVERNYAILHELLEANAKIAADPKTSSGSAAQIVGQLYASGMDEALINAEGAKPLEPEFDLINKIVDRDGLAPAVAQLHLLGFGPFFGVTGGQDSKESTSQIAIIGQGGLGLPDRDYYLKDGDRSKEIREQYALHIAKMFGLLGDAESVATDEASRILALETELAKASKSRVALRDSEANYHRMSVTELTTLAPGFDWINYYKALGLTDEQVSKINVGQPEFFKRLAELTATYSLDDLKIYLRWNVLRETAPDLSAPFEDENFQFYQERLTGVKAKLPRWKKILKEVDANVGEALGQLYVEKHFSEDSKKRALEMVNDLKESFREKIKQLDWMEDATKKAALTKLDAFGVKIGYPDKWRDYSSLEIKKQPFVLNILAANKFETKRQLGKIGKPVDRSEWGMSPPTVNAYYSQNKNEIVFPAGILQRPLFDANADDAANYGGMGAVIGHEMTHGFDDQGRKFDPHGNLNNWWTEEDAKRFEARGAKIVKQFSQYEVIDHLHINGELTEGENIADLGGVKIAYAAFEKALHRKSAEEQAKKIDGFTQEQRFFLAWAQIWRNNTRPETMRLRLQTDPHSPGKFRVNGPLSNLPEFAAAFGIGSGSPMIRPEEERVEIW
jgi:putative endopeptidase